MEWIDRSRCKTWSYFRSSRALWLSVMSRRDCSLAAAPPCCSNTGFKVIFMAAPGYEGYSIVALSRPEGDEIELRTNIRLAGRSTSDGQEPWSMYVRWKDPDKLGRNSRSSTSREEALSNERVASPHLDWRGLIVVSDLPLIPLHKAHFIIFVLIKWLRHPSLEISISFPGEHLLQQTRIPGRTRDFGRYGMQKQGWRSSFKVPYQIEENPYSPNKLRVSYSRTLFPGKWEQ